MLLLSKLKISGHSMEPSFRNGDKVLASFIPYLFKKLQINDVVVFQDNKNNIFIKRIKKIKDKKFFVAGDNKNDSLDSRSLGYINKYQILGKIIAKL